MTQLPTRKTAPDRSNAAATTKVKHPRRKQASHPASKVKSAASSPSRIPRKSKSKSPAPSPPVEPVTQNVGVSKQDRLLSLLRQPNGATIADLMRVTGWQAHSVRGVISGKLRKRLGLTVIAETSPTGERCYRIVGTEAS